MLAISVCGPVISQNKHWPSNHAPDFHSCLLGNRVSSYFRCWPRSWCVGVENSGSPQAIGTPTRSPLRYAHSHRWLPPPRSIYKYGERRNQTILRPYIWGNASQVAAVQPVNLGIDTLKRPYWVQFGWASRDSDSDPVPTRQNCINLVCLWLTLFVFAAVFAKQNNPLAFLLHLSSLLFTFPSVPRK